MNKTIVALEHREIERANIQQALPPTCPEIILDTGHTSVVAYVFNKQ